MNQMTLGKDGDVGEEAEREDGTTLSCCFTGTYFLRVSLASFERDCTHGRPFVATGGPMKSGIRRPLLARGAPPLENPGCAPGADD